MGCADQAALDAGVDPQTIAEWTRQVKAERVAALARDASQIRYQTSRRLTEDDIRALSLERFVDHCPGRARSLILGWLAEL